MDPTGYNLFSNLALLAAEYKAIVQNARFLEICFFITFGLCDSTSSQPRNCVLFLSDKCFQGGHQLLFWDYFYKRK